MKGELDNIRAWGTYLSTIKNDCDVIMGATFKIEDDEKSGGYTVTVVGYPGVFTNWHTVIGMLCTWGVSVIKNKN